MKCPECNGEREILGALPVWVSNVPLEKRKPYVVLPCPRCEGKGVVPDEMEEWIKQGKQLRKKRTDIRLTLRKASEQLGIDGVVLSNMEAGFMKPDLTIEY